MIFVRFRIVLSCNWIAGYHDAAAAAAVALVVAIVIVVAVVLAAVVASVFFHVVFVVCAFCVRSSGFC